MQHSNHLPIKSPSIHLKFRVIHGRMYFSPSSILANLKRISWMCMQLPQVPLNTTNFTAKENFTWTCLSLTSLCWIIFFFSASCSLSISSCCCRCFSSSACRFCSASSFALCLLSSSRASFLSLSSLSFFIFSCNSMRLLSSSRRPFSKLSFLLSSKVTRQKKD